MNQDKSCKAEFYEKLGAIEDDGKAQLEIAEHLKKAKRQHGKSLQQHELWREYLKRSDRYRQVCDWFKAAKRRSPYNLDSAACKSNIGYVQDFFMFASSYERLYSPPFFSLETVLGFTNLAYENELMKGMISDTFFSWAIDAGYPENFGMDMLGKLFVFGNIHEDPPESYLLRVIHILRKRGRVEVFQLHEIFSFVFTGVHDQYPEKVDRATLQEYQEICKRYVQNSPMLFLGIINPFANKEDVLKVVGDLIDRLRNKIPPDMKKRAKSMLQNECPFELPTTDGRFDERQRYLKAYGLKQDGKTNKEIAAEIYPGLHPEAQDTFRRVLRDREKAARIIENVEHGVFPGNYTGTSPEPEPLDPSERPAGSEYLSY